MARNLSTIYHDLLAIFYPDLCLSCGNQLIRGEKILCILCKHDLPETNFHLDPDNPVFKHFWGRVEISHAASFYYFSKGSRIQRLMHQLKYEGKREIGIQLGELYAQRLIKSPLYRDLDMIIPVPLHPKKEHKRGFNQSLLFAKGLGRGLQKPVYSNILVRRVFTDTQTRKSRLQRWRNVRDVFQVITPGKIKGKSVLLVDDVITTGSTMEACAAKLLETQEVVVMAVSIACADHL